MLTESAVGSDAYTTTTRALARIGDPSWEWLKPLVFVRVRPSVASDPRFVEWFRGSLEPWRVHWPMNNPCLLDVDESAGLVAVFGDDRGISLEVICDSLTPTSVLPRALAARIIDAVFVGLRARHELDIVHGAVSLDAVSIGYDGSVTVGIGRPWDPLARMHDDLRCAERLRQDLLERSTVVKTKQTLRELVRGFQ